MKTHRFLLFAIGLLAGACLGSPGRAADDSTPPYQADLRALHDRIGAGLKANPQSGPELASGAIAEAEALLAKYAGQPDAQSAIALDQVYFLLHMLRDEDAAKARAEALQKNYPGTKGAELAGKILRSLSPEGKAESAVKMAETKARQAEAQAKRDALTGKVAPEIDFTWSTRDGLKHLADLRGNVVVLDFWATWCGPCIASFPKVRQDVARFAHSPVVFLGVTSLQGRVHGLEAKPIDVKDDPAKEYALTAEFIRKHEMTWPVAFSAQKVFNPDYAVLGIPYIAIIAPDGKVRHAGLNPHTPGVDLEGKITAILKEFSLPLPN